MEKFIFSFIGVMFAYLFCLICSLRLLKINIKSSGYKFYLSLFILTTCGTIINLLVPQFLRLICVVILQVIVLRIFFCKSFARNLIAILLAELIMIISEMVFVLISSFIYDGGISELYKSAYGILIINFFISLFAFVFLKFPFIYKIFHYLVNTFDNMKRSNLIVYFVLTVALISIFLIMSYMNLPSNLLLIANTVLTLFYIIMLFRLANARENYRSVNNKYETSLNSLREYEEIMDKYRVANHENKNQLLTIRNMINKNDKKTANYIDKLVDNKIKDNETIFYKASKIPEGGLRAIIYSKLCKMENMGIKYDLDIANDVKTVDVLEIGDTTILNSCKIVGVFLDNAIEAVSKLRKKYIVIEIFVMDDNLYIDISNNYSGIIEVDKIDKKKYTTKGEGHGYGLSLVNEIVKNCDTIDRETKISKDMFTQRLKIKM